MDHKVKNVDESREERSNLIQLILDTVSSTKLTAEDLIELGSLLKMIGISIRGICKTCGKDTDECKCEIEDIEEE